MDSIELNKIAAAVVCAAALLAGSVLAARLLVPDERPDRTLVPIPGLQQRREAPSPRPTASTAPAAAATTDDAVAARLAHASAARGGELAAAQCGGCHSLAQGGGVQVGPPLSGIGNAAVAANTAYPGYSLALQKLGGRWTADRLDRWLAGPNAMAPGTSMGFSGIADPAARADVVVFLLARKEAAR